MRTEGIRSKNDQNSRTVRRIYTQHTAYTLEGQRQLMILFRWLCVSLSLSFSFSLTWRIPYIHTFSICVRMYTQCTCKRRRQYSRLYTLTTYCTHGGGRRACRRRSHYFLLKRVDCFKSTAHRRTSAAAETCAERTFGIIYILMH